MEKKLTNEQAERLLKTIFAEQDNETEEMTAEEIEGLREQLKASQRKARDARNELCLKCGRYREAHNGACDGCKWKLEEEHGN